MRFYLKAQASFKKGHKLMDSFAENIKLNYKFYIYFWIFHDTHLKDQLTCMKLNSQNSSPYHMNHSEDKLVTVSVFQQMSSAATTKPQPWSEQWLRWHRIPSGPRCRKGHSPSLLMDQMMLTPNSFPCHSIY